MFTLRLPFLFHLLIALRTNVFARFGLLQIAFGANEQFALVSLEWYILLALLLPLLPILPHPICQSGGGPLKTWRCGRSPALWCCFHGFDPQIQTVDDKDWFTFLQQFQANLPLFFSVSYLFVNNFENDIILL